MITVKTEGGMKITCESVERAVQIASGYPTAGKVDQERVAERATELSTGVGCGVIVDDNICGTEDEDFEAIYCEKCESVINTIEGMLQ